MAHPAGAIQQRRGLSGAPTQIGGIHDVRTNKQWTYVMHHKRKRARTSPRHAFMNETSRRAQLGIKPVRIREIIRAVEIGSQEWRDLWKHAYYDTYLSKGPSWYHILFHSRPHRRATKRLEHIVLRDWKDPDDITWPLRHKPHKYYW